ncbi:hypothetical protein NE237_028644 [Protea cynaroides]|uniref:Uncharacterized protein n=1 Tax=Protea cynaroides TaxID=273540 RepID=A0A9Q0JUA1_9MAGN|nr:hypothetical protein NE237_028644 [Protea cynaroides]
MNGLARVNCQLYFEFQQGINATLARAARHEITPITILATASTLLRYLLQGLQDQHRRIMARMATECKAPTNQGTSKRPMGTTDEKTPRKRAILQSTSCEQIQRGQFKTVPMITTSPSKIPHMMRGCTIPKTAILCQCCRKMEHRTQNCQGYWECYP